ncbi:S-layer family protein [Paenibacillus taihuensis]|uniref:Alpha-galactosidase n=1 Tax=Paenibacillus taihuensis TaxID=1156355 RepID=A0A3D9S399_9BACL|nr:X2-like carbohydrate binding domain-containing protein [Paenibacillus taihuensis]REE86495.1 S-layer family protein [Paenibacillus taihuensis]
MKLKLKKSGFVLLLASLVVAQFGLIPAKDVAKAADNGLATKPYMGWSSYSLQVYDGPGGNWTSAAKIKQQSDAMHEKLQSHGYEYINIDAGWNGGMDEYGRPIPSTTLYPDGFKNVIDYVHHNGQKIGIYMIPGLSPAAYDADLPIYGAPGCSMKDIAAQPLRQADYWEIGYKIDFESDSSKGCAQAYIDSIADLIASWGIDFVKFDSVTPGSGHNDTKIDARGDVEAWSKALARQDHKIWFELSWALDPNYADFWKAHANGWRVDWDVESYDSNVGMTQWVNIARLFPDAALWWRHAGPGGWNDFDSLDIGNGSMDGLTKDERQSAMTLWAMSSAQLYTGDDMTKLDDYGLSLLTNDEVIAVNQAGHPAHPVSTATKSQVWYANNGDGTYTVALFNLGSRESNVSVNWSDIGLNGGASVRDLWSHKDLGNFASGYTAQELQPHASRLFKVKASGGGISSVNDDDTGMKYVGEWQRNGGYEVAPSSQDLEVAISDSSVSNQTVNEQQVQEQQEQQVTTLDAPTSHYAVMNDNNADIVYSDGWQSSTGRNFGDYQGDVHYAQADGAQLTYTFNGTGIDFITETDSSQGSIDFYIDDVFDKTVNTSGSGTRGAGQTVYSVADLPSGQHTLKAVKHSNSSGDFMLVDALKVTSDSLLGSTEEAFDNSNPSDVTTTLSFGADSLKGIRNGDATLEAGSDYTVSGNMVTIKQAYLAQLSEGQTDFTFDFAGGDSQTFAVTVTGVPVSNPTPEGRYASINNDDPAIQYDGSWTRNSGRGLGDYMDDVQYSQHNGDSFQYTFRGTGVQYITEMDSSQGEVDIYIDGVFKQTVDTHSSGRLAKQIVYEINGLTDSQHTIKAVKKSGDYMLLDMLKVRIADLIDPTTAAFDRNPSEQTDLTVNLLERASHFSIISNGSAVLVKGTDYTVSGTVVTIKKSYLASLPAGSVKLSFSFDGDYQQDVHATAINGDYVTYTFIGTGIELLGPTGPAQGEMDIYVDGVLKTTVNAYSEERLLLQHLYGIDGLAGSQHTVKIVKKSGDLLLIDRLNYTVSTASAAQPPTSGTSTPPVGSGSTEIINGNVNTGASGDGIQVAITRTTQANGTKQDTVTFGEDAAKSAAEKLKAAGVHTATIVIPDEKGEVSETNVTIPQASKQVMADDGLDLGIDTASAGIEIPNASLQGYDGDAAFKFVPVKDTAAQGQIEDRANKAAVVTAAVGGSEVALIGKPVAIETNFQGRAVDVILPVDAALIAGLEPGQLGVYIEHSDGTTEYKQAVIVEWNGGKGLRFTTDKFSTFAIVKHEVVTSNHSAYMKGFAGGLFKPGSQITRAEMAAILSRVVTREGTEGEIRFQDVKSGHWAAGAIAKVTKLGLMRGFTDGTFKPEKPVTRAEMASLVSALLTGDVKKGAGFKDIAGSWAEQAILNVQGAGVIKGFEDGTFRPNLALTRAEAAAIINRVLGRGPLYGEANLPWKDVPSTYWAYADIAEASLDHAYTARTDGGEQLGVVNAIR